MEHKYRIIEITRKNGETGFLIQKRTLPFPIPVKVWKTYHDGSMSWDSDSWYICKQWGTFYSTLESAEEDLYEIQRCNKRTISEVKVVKEYDDAFAITE